MRLGRNQLASLYDDPFLEPFREHLRRRRTRARELEQRLTTGATDLLDLASGHEYFGLHQDGNGWTLTEWLPNARRVYMVGDAGGWQALESGALEKIEGRGIWQLRLPPEALKHGDHYRLRVHWDGGEGDRIPAYARRVVQDPHTGIFAAQVWNPDATYQWTHPDTPTMASPPLIYEAHVGIAQEHGRTGTYVEFRDHIIPRVVDAGYNTLQLMAVAEHPYYASFGYQVASFFAASSRFGTPEELKSLVDCAHAAGLRVIMDLVHSHAVRNETEGLSRFDGTLYQYFHEGEKGMHPVWDSRCFDYGKVEVLHFLLSNCRFWLDEYHMDGFRFDGVTSMLFDHHGLGTVFTSYEQYFDTSVDQDALAYLTLANKLIHRVRPAAITIAEDVSGMPGLGAAIDEGGAGFDYRLAMGVPDCWFELAGKVKDEDWDLALLWHELTNRRADERTISYVECHDQAMVGGKSFIFQLLDADMYERMRGTDSSPLLDRGMALHKMARLLTLMTAGHGYLNFMGNEFGHPEWIDLPREGNGWSYHYARRQWHLRDDPELKYHALAEFDKAMLPIAGDRERFENCQPRRLCHKHQDMVLAFERAGTCLFANFHPTQSHVDYAVEAPPGEYALVLDSDDERFGGQGRIHPGQRYFTQPLRDGDTLRHCLLLYLPSRTALVLRQERD